MKYKNRGCKQYFIKLIITLKKDSKTYESEAANNIKANSVLMPPCITAGAISFNAWSMRAKRGKKTTHAIQKQLPEVFSGKAVRKSFAIITGKHLCWSLLCLRPATLL